MQKIIFFFAFRLVVVMQIDSEKSLLRVVEQ